MEQICYDILEAWAKYSNFDPNRTQFNLLSYEYKYHEATKKIEKLVNEYDKSGVLAVLTIKHLFLQVMKDAHITLYDAMTKPQALQEHIDMLDLFQCKEILDAEKHYTDKLKLLISKILGTQLIESSDETDTDAFNEKIITCTDSVIRNLEKCHDEVYVKSGNPIGIIDNFSTKILTFPTLAECILALNKADDGIYLCYIDAHQTSDGYFGFFVKSNGNLLSVNERISENFRGQHANSRNGRWAEDKAVGIFPYDFIFSYGEHDYKGYAWNYNIDDTKLSLSLLEENAYLPLLIAMVFVAGRLSEKNLNEYEVTYTENLLSINMPLLTKDANELMVLANNDLVVATNSLNLSFDYDKIMDGTVFDEFKNTKFLYSDNRGQIFVDLYGAGFQPQPTFNMQKYLTDKNVNHVNELVATAPKMRAYALMDIRTQLVAYIKDKMHEEFVNFGGFDAIYKWFTEVINSNIEKIKKLAIEEYVNVKTLRKGGRCSANVIVKSGTYGVDLREDD